MDMVCESKETSILDCWEVRLTCHGWLAGVLVLDIAAHARSLGGRHCSLAVLWSLLGKVCLSVCPLERMIAQCQEIRLFVCLHRARDHPVYICMLCHDRVYLIRLDSSILQQVQDRGEEVQPAVRVEAGRPRRGRVQLLPSSLDRNIESTEGYIVFPGATRVCTSMNIAICAGGRTNSGQLEHPTLATHIQVRRSIEEHNDSRHKKNWAAVEQHRIIGADASW